MCRAPAPRSARDACAERLQPLRALEDDDLGADPPQGERGRQAADPGADDDRAHTGSLGYRSTPMARKREKEPLPPPLPPETRTVGQLVAESIRLYGRRFWASLALGVPPAAFAVLVAEFDLATRVVILPVIALVLSVSYVGAAVIVSGRRPPPRSLATALAAGAITYLPVPFLAILFLLPALFWLGLLGLSVPVAIVEGTGLRDSFARAVRLARADYVHAVGSLATLVIAVFLTQSVLFLLLHGTTGQTNEIAAFLAILVIWPILFLGAALLYFDQAARVSSGSRSERRRDADVSHALDADRPGPQDAPVESRPAAGGQ